MATALVVLLAGGGLAVALGGDGAEDLRPETPDMIYAGVPITAAAPQFTIGSLNIEEPGRAVTVLSVTPLMSSNVEYLGAFTIWPRDFPANKLAVGPGFPPSQMKERHPLTELVPAAETGFVPAADTDGIAPPLAVAAGFRLLSGDVGAVNGIQVVFTVDGKTVTRVYREAAIVCLPDCEKHPDWDKSDFENLILGRLGLLP